MGTYIMDYSKITFTKNRFLRFQNSDRVFQVFVLNINGSGILSQLNSQRC